MVIVGVVVEGVVGEPVDTGLAMVVVEEDDEAPGSDRVRGRRGGGEGDGMRRGRRKGVRMGMESVFGWAG